MTTKLAGRPNILATTATFHPFSCLPFELRERIWYLTSLEPRIIHVQLHHHHMTGTPRTHPRVTWRWSWENQDAILTRNHPDGRAEPYPWTKRQQTLRITTRESRDAVEHFAMVRLLQLPPSLELKHEFERLADFARHVDFESDIFYLSGFPLTLDYPYREGDPDTVVEMPEFLTLLHHVVLSLQQADRAVAEELIRRRRRGEDEETLAHGCSVHSFFYGLLKRRGYPRLETITIMLSPPDTIGHDFGRLVKLDCGEVERRYGGSYRANQALTVMARVKALVPNLQLGVMEGAARLDHNGRSCAWKLWFFREVLMYDGRVGLIQTGVVRGWEDQEQRRRVLDAVSAQEIRRFWASREATDHPLRPEDYAQFPTQCTPLGPKIPYPYTAR